jgi:NADH-quinone oxidoreductase subunit N
VIRAAADTHNWTLAVIAMLTAVVSAFVYLRIVVAMYFPAQEDEAVAAVGPPVRIPWAAGVAVSLAVVGTLALGLIPQPFSSLTDDAVAQLATVGR